MLARRLVQGGACARPVCMHACMYVCREVPARIHIYGGYGGYGGYGAYMRRRIHVSFEEEDTCVIHIYGGYGGYGGYAAIGICTS